jgi:hypothetical protein
VVLVNETTHKIIGEKEARTVDVEIDFSGFNKSCTYYVLYDDDGKETIGDTIDKVMPANWYNYAEKKWANIVTINDMGTEDTSDDLTSYWTYIPRYEYKINSASQYVDIEFISVDQTEPDSGYKIPATFNFGTKKDENGESKPLQLKGYWMSKYEIQNK